ncbi:uncharacterized protein LOC127903107 [Citrus sinensis]|uniref:uncharacterized protein LOC127903107 n=1 Tax=Citrus sinensis TaxID=2711 RepID=UPI002279DA24|nr:uncharacterized protein LOC127903107 [Citrus sinensis]
MLPMIDNLKDFNMAASSVPPVVSQQNMDTPRPSSVARDGTHDAKNKIKEGYSSAKPIELLIINVVPLTVVPALGYQKPKRRKRGRDPLTDSRKVGSPNGWMYEQRERANVKYVDQC